MQHGDGVQGSVCWEQAGGLAPSHQDPGGAAVPPRPLLLAVSFPSSALPYCTLLVPCGGGCWVQCNAT